MRIKLTLNIHLGKLTFLYVYTYQGNTKVKVDKLRSLRRNFEKLQIKKSESGDQFMNQVLNIVNQIRYNSE